MVSLMDRLLKAENLDLCLTPYKVLATGQDEGMLEFIPSRSLAQVVYLGTHALMSIYVHAYVCDSMIVRAARPFSRYCQSTEV